MDITTLIQQTQKLLAACEEASERFYKMREEDRSPDFYNEVKPYADEMRDLLRNWQTETYAFIETRQPKYVHKVQIDNALDAMEQFFVQSFYKETSKKRFLQSITAVQYTLDTLLRKIGDDRDV